MSNPPSRLTVRLLEIFPGTLTWATLIASPLLSYYHPVWVSIYIILFDLYWFLKAGNVAFHLMHSYRTLKTHKMIDWNDWLKRLSDKQAFQDYLAKLIQTEKNRKLRNLYQEQIARFKQNPSDVDYRKIYHLIILPTFKEDESVLSSSIESYIQADYPKAQMIFVLAGEERAEGSAGKLETLRQKYGNKFFKFMAVLHPDGIPGEARVKGANITFAAKAAQKFLDESKIPYQDVIISAFDSDTTVSKNYFAHLSYDFLTIDKPMQASYQPMPMYHNNIWDTPAIARVIATSSSFWQMVEASRPDRLITFSSHSMNFKTLVDVGFWRVDIIPEDSHIFWQCFLHFNGDYRTMPLFTTISMDAVLGESYFKTLVAQYKQKRRWAWGVTEISLVFPEFYRNKLIPLWKRLLYGERLVEGHYFWATASIVIALLGWLPLLFGGAKFGETVLAVNLPFLTKTIMTIATFFLIFSMYINMVLLPPRPPGMSRFQTLYMLLQWIFAPIVSSVFGSFPAIDAQTRLMFGRYMEFWVTPKVRKRRFNFRLGSSSKIRELNGPRVKL
ncbi:MAG TPA: glycosyltransferase family 2 protein [Patescibacteria group bacterium]|jgi:cellulose synthase/poly-beta-1,6-N-acetylglucosamine synthase-like glycosyltransferase|nr:glycosyltransferase family 2 protein [Patescibacteria group bacterium]